MRRALLMLMAIALMAFLIAITMGMARDFWAAPEYPKLMSSMEAILGPYVTQGKGSAEQTAQKLVAEHTKIFQAAGYYK